MSETATPDPIRALIDKLMGDVQDQCPKTPIGRTAHRVLGELLGDLHRAEPTIFETGQEFTNHGVETTITIGFAIEPDTEPATY